MPEHRDKDAQRLSHAYIISAQSPEESLSTARRMAAAAVCSGNFIYNGKADAAAAQSAFSFEKFNLYIFKVFGRDPCSLVCDVDKYVGASV